MENHYDFVNTKVNGSSREIERDTPLQTRILKDILHPEFAEAKPQGSTLKVVWFKTRRFFANRWKHRLVYRESIPSQFLHGSIAHLRRFGTICRFAQKSVTLQSLFA